jgi:MFS transporter, putative metabolite:H+ symporter
MIVPEATGPVPPRRTLHGRVTLVAGLAFGSNGLILGVLSFALLGLRSAWGLAPAQVSALTMASGAGQLLGGIVMGHTADVVGRRLGYGVSVAVSSLATGAAALAPTLGWMLPLIFLAGLGFGGVAPALTSLVGEFAPPGKRGALMGWTQVIWTFGWIIAAAGGVLLAHSLGWRGVFAVGIAPLALAVLGPRLVPESPRFLLAHGRRREAEELAGTLGARFGAAPEMPPQEHAVRASVVAHLRELWSPRFRRRSALLWSVWFVMIGTFNGPVVWLPSLVAAAGFGRPAEASFLVALAMLPPTIASTLLLDRLGRKPVMIVALTAAGVGAAVVAAAHSEPIFILGAAGLAGGVLAAWPVILSYAAELYPTRIRSTATGWASAAGRTAAILAPAMMGALMTTWATGREVALSVCAGALGAAALIVLFIGEETAGRPLEEVADRSLERRT